jgi:hypothetical protein
MKRFAPILALAIAFAAQPARADDAPDTKDKASASVDPSAALDVHYPPPLVRLKLITAGVLVTGAAWGVAFACAQAWPEVPQPKDGSTVETGPPGSNQLKIPIAGPWIALAKSGCAADDPDCGAKVAVRGVLYVLDGIAQLAGLGLIAEAIVMKTESPPAKRSSFLTIKKGTIEMTPVPITTPTMTGFGFAGTF